MTKTAVVAMVLAAGLAGAIEPARAADLPLVSFGAGGGLTVSRPLASGAPLRLHYDIARLPHCRAVYHGLPAWDILASWSVDGGPAHSQALTTVDASGQRVGVDITLSPPPGHDLALWFMASDEYGCVEWDSDYGRNFHVPLAGGAPAIHFRWPGWEVDSDGVLAAGGDVWIDYDIRRLPWCRQTYNGLQTWDVHVQYRVDGGGVQAAPLTALAPDGQRVSAPARLSLPAGSHSLALWFENDDRTGCVAWDSQYGANYVFAPQ